MRVFVEQKGVGVFSWKFTSQFTRNKPYIFKLCQKLGTDLYPGLVFKFNPFMHFCGHKNVSRVLVKWLGKNYCLSTSMIYGKEVVVGALCYSQCTDTTMWCAERIRIWLLNVRYLLHCRMATQYGHPEGLNKVLRRFQFCYSTILLENSQYLEQLRLL